MSTEFLTLLPPPGAALAAYNRTKHSDQQPGSIPQLFKDAMSVREAVYVEEQGVPLANELDDDDARSWHWIVYASVGTTSTSSSRSPPKSHTWHKRRASKEDQEDADRRRSSATASRVPVGTIRLIPPPHPPNPYITHDPHSPTTTAAAAAAHDPHPDADPPAPVPLPTEPFVKLGRLATLPAYRKLGLSRLLINAALEWAAANPTQVLRPPSPATLEAARLEGREEEEQWRGLAMVHAQVSVEGLWARFGFREEFEGVPKEGRWWEEGIEHLGMWRRLRVKE